MPSISAKSADQDFSCSWSAAGTPSIPAVTIAGSGAAKSASKEGAIPVISGVEGFMGYYVVYAPDDTVIAISLFNNFAAAEESNKRALAWIEHDLAPLLTGPATAMAGPVIVHTLA